MSKFTIAAATKPLSDNVLEPIWDLKSLYPDHERTQNVKPSAHDTKSQRAGNRATSDHLVNVKPTASKVTRGSGLLAPKPQSTRILNFENSVRIRRDLQALLPTNVSTSNIPAHAKLDLAEEALTYLTNGNAVPCDWKDEVSMYLCWIDWKPLIDLPGEAGVRAKNIWLRAVQYELTNTKRVTFPITDPKLLEHLPPQLLEIVVREYMMRMGTIIANIEDLSHGRIALANTAFHRSSFHHANDIFHHIMIHAHRIVLQKPSLYSARALELVKKYMANQKYFSEQTRELDVIFPANSPFAVTDAVA